MTFGCFGLLWIDLVVAALAADTEHPCEVEAVGPDGALGSERLEWDAQGRLLALDHSMRTRPGHDLVTTHRFAWSPSEPAVHVEIAVGSVTQAREVWDIRFGDQGEMVGRTFTRDGALEYTEVWTWRGMWTSDMLHSQDGSDQIALLSLAREWEPGTLGFDGALVVDVVDARGEALGRRDVAFTGGRPVHAEWRSGSWLGLDDVIDWEYAERSVRRTTRSGILTVFRLDRRGRLVRKKTTVHGQPGQAVETFTYVDDGLLRAIDRDAGGSVVRYTYKYDCSP